MAGMDDVVDRILMTYDTITVVGARGDQAKAAGMLYVEDRCLAIEQRRLGLRAPVRRAVTTDSKDAASR